ncbi:MAG: ATP synthase F1 subunit epsilon [Lachnospiraceae bacterium]|nr:ATP synthase F1 subunit epsilon [Lachnospiraceae bacterium]MBR5667913.1 ATP synthase F1 subunit epsilon [Lachnospiraceae bacterium]
MSDKQLKLNIYSPSRIFYEGEADFVEFVTTEGELGIYPDHIPLTAVVAPGILRITKDGKVREATLLDGFATVLPREITVLSEACEWPEEIDIHRAEEAKIRAERKLAMEQTLRDELALRRALVRIQMASKAK